MRRRTELRTLISAGKHLDDCEEIYMEMLMCVQTVCVFWGDGQRVRVHGSVELQL